MGIVPKSLRSVVIVAAAGAVLWNLFLDERAKQSVQRSVKVTGEVASHLLNEYMDPMGRYSSEEADEYNRSWVEHQWKSIGY